jgi:DNA-directed RNA polymerase specialized sigma subunit
MEKYLRGSMEKYLRDKDGKVWKSMEKYLRDKDGKVWKSI